MKIIKKAPRRRGNYAPMQSWEAQWPVPEGYAVVPEGLDTEAFYAHNGFVKITVEDGAVTAMEPDTEAWEAWKASLPEESADTAEVSTEELLLEMAVDHEARICAIELGV